MKIHNRDGSTSHLSYCSNIHAGESWDEVLANLHTYIPDMQRALVPEAEFGIGLRLSAAAARDLDSPERVAELQDFLDGNNSYVFTLNGFPYGPFHGTRVKEDVYLPDWKDAERLRYTNQLADVFAQFLPEDTTGSISTVPGAFKACVSNVADEQNMAHNMVAHVAHLVRLERRTGKSMVLALEPEPCCFLETIEESTAFFTRHLFGPDARKQLCKELGIDTPEAERLLHRHLTLCLDLCHAAVEFEDCDACFDQLEQAEISIGKLQISAGLRLPRVTMDSAEALRPFFDKVYLHQVVERVDGQTHRFKDLPDAFEALHANEGAVRDREWRIHFHVPIFLDDLGEFSSTQFFVRDALQRHKTNPVSEHLEVETYTWDVLPTTYRTLPIEQAIAHELTWVRNALEQANCDAGAM